MPNGFRYIIIMKAILSVYISKQIVIGRLVGLNFQKLVFLKVVAIEFL